MCEVITEKSAVMNISPKMVKNEDIKQEIYGGEFIFLGIINLTQSEHETIPMLLTLKIKCMYVRASQFL